MAGLQGGDVFRLVMDHPPAGAHAPHVVDRLGIDRIFRGDGAVRAVRQALSLADQELVMNPAVFRVEIPGRNLVDRDHQPGRNRLVLEILLAPGVHAPKGLGLVVKHGFGWPRC